MGLACLLGWVSSAAADESFTSTGPIERVWVGEDLACQVSYEAGDTYEFYPPQVAPGDCGVFLSLDGQLYAPAFGGHTKTATGNLGDYESWTPVSERVVGDGTATNPFQIITEASAGGKVTLTQTVTYVTGKSTFTVSIALRNETAGSLDTRVYFAGDCYASGSDIGYGFRRPEIRSAGCSQNPDNNPAARTVQVLPSSAGSRSVEDRFYDVWRRIGNQEAFDDGCLCSLSVDNGVGVEWKVTLNAASTETKALDVAFTESTPPAPPADSDGDSLPDAWETGAAGSDAENLAALGADPARKDIFVHVDWMKGCQPDAGWETRAIDLFAAHGIALHIDAGEASMNIGAGAPQTAPRAPWGAASRGGEVPWAETVDLRSDWAQVDTLKDLRFVPSKRRRAFHYVLFADKLRTASLPDPSYQAISRGIPDSDVAIGNCHNKPVPGGPDVRGDTTFFVHELGHNLGLRHGGFEDHNFKPNYASIMSYGWVWYLLKDNRRFIGYSDQLRPNIDERNVSERGGIQGPVAWWCGVWPKQGGGSTLKNSVRTGVLTDLDLDCDGRYGERSVKANIDGGFDPNAKNSSGQLLFTPMLDSYSGFNDWTAIKFTGGGVVGSATLPLRQDTAPQGELSEPEIQQAAASEQRQVAAAAKQLRVSSKTRQLRKPKRRRKKSRVTVLVTDLNGRPVRHASVRVKGGTLAKGRTRRRTDSKGRVELVLRLRSSKELQVIADRGGYRRSELLIAVVRR